MMELRHHFRTVVWNFSYSTIELGGCNQEYPLYTPSAAAVTRAEQLAKGYGDGLKGTAPGTKGFR